jgi:hypothetical protein
MYKVRAKYEGVLIQTNNQTFTIYNILDQSQLEYYHKLLGSEFVYFVKDKTNKDVSDK